MRNRLSDDQVFACGLALGSLILVGNVVVLILKFWR